MSNATPVHIHYSRYPVKILKRLVPADPRSTSSSSANYAQRLCPLFSYEAQVDIGAHNSTLKSESYGNGASAASNSKGKGKGKGREAARGDDAAGPSPYYGGNVEEELLDSQRHIYTYESPIEGSVVEWCVQDGAVLTNPDLPILKIQEPCKHPVQLGGLCAVCGKDLTGVDYSGFSETSRATISMSHDNSNLTVSMEEASRLERQTSTRLRKEKKLSLIVDLDQTIIQATVDPTIGDWMSDPKDPNHDALYNVQRFKLLNEVTGKEEGCWYYVKPRPELERFMKELSRLYEMHVYTMGTRQYAENVCRIIDPDGKIFANRILSRDESGSMSHKSLQRLFPVDQSMVVVIDDRGDVWDWSPNLVKVVPFEFFVGIGDINAAFLPKIKSAIPEAASSSSSSTTGSTAATSPATSVSASEQQETALAITAQNENLDQQIAEKPLAHLQEAKKSAMIHEAVEKEKAAKSGSSTPAPSEAASEAPSTPSGLGNTPTKANTPGGASPVALAMAEEPANLPTPPNQQLPSPPKPKARVMPATPSEPPPNAANGIGSSRFVSKMQTDGDSDSDDEDDSDEDDEEVDAAEKKEVSAKSPQPASATAPKTAATSPSQRSTTPPLAPSESARPLETNAESSADAPVDIVIDEPEKDGDSTKAPHQMTEDEAIEEEILSTYDPKDWAVLVDNDTELERVLAVLQDVHREFYESAGSESVLGNDVADIIPRMKRKVLQGCNIVFSGVIPLDQEPSRSEIWKTAQAFGATCSNVLQNRTTHVVAAKSGTSKVNQARRRKEMHIVTPRWLLESAAQWQRQPEKDWTLALEAGEGESAASGNGSVDTPRSFPDSPEPEPPDAMMDGDLEDGEGGNSSLHVDWGDAQAEIEAFLHDEGTDDDDDGMASGNNTADESETDSQAGRGAAEAVGKKRQRSSPASSTSSSASGSSRSRADAAGFSTSGPSGESPLAKRRKVAAARIGHSKLKMSESIDALEAGTTVSTSSASSIRSNSPAAVSKDGGGGTVTSDEEEDDDDDLDDFAKALEGELS